MNRRQLEWRCRRGVRELDVLFTRFLDEEYDRLDTELQLAFQSLLSVQDPQIMDWLFDKTEPSDQKVQQLINRLQLQSGLLK